MSYTTEMKVAVRVLSPESISVDDYRAVLLDMETTFNRKATRYRVHIIEAVIQRKESKT